MVAGGVFSNPHKDVTNAVNLSFDMLNILKEFNTRENLSLELRIGIHIGPAIAGVIGKKKFTYDVWGDTVNIASRMESHGLPGEIQISQDIYQIVKDDYTFKKRPKIKIKGKGDMCTYLIRPKEAVLSKN